MSVRHGMAKRETRQGLADISALYEWILGKYPKIGDKILDTHVGSASSLIACERMGFSYVGFELDEYYYGLAKERLVAEKVQMSIFDLGVERI